MRKHCPRRFHHVMSVVFAICDSLLLSDHVESASVQSTLSELDYLRLARCAVYTVCGRQKGLIYR